MTGQPSRLARGIGRSALGVLTMAAAVLLLAPVAVASPESDANDAINQAWDSSGGATSSPLGARDGGVYAVGEGFGQNFAGGKIFFTPATGAKIMYGAILDKYQSLGGPADSDLGFPNIDEVPGLIGPDSRVSTFSAGDKPVIFWTPETGAWVVRGAINAAWDKLGGSAGALGVPVEDERYSGGVVTQKFSGGELSWNSLTKAFTTVPPELGAGLEGLEVPTDATAAINTAWRAAGGASGPLGARQGAQYAIGDDGAAQNFAGGKVFFSPATGASAVGGDILAKYESMGGPTGELGFPTSSEADGGVAPASRISTFAAPDKPVIFWTPDHGAVVVRGAMNAAWGKLGGATGALGAPIADQTVSGDTFTQKFSGGEISWNKANNTFTTKPPDLASSLSGLEVPNSPTGSTPITNADNGFTWHWWWLLVIIPVLLLLAVLLLGALRSRRRGAADHLEATEDADAEVDAATGYDALPTDHEIPAPVGRWAGRAEAAGGFAAGVGAGGEHGMGVLGSTDEDFELENSDAVDTAPTRVQSDAEAYRGRHSVLDLEAPRAAWASVDDDNLHPPDDDVSRYRPAPAAVDSVEERVEAAADEDVPAGHPAIHLPLEDPYAVPPGYPIKANLHTGLYYTPDCALYDDTVAEIWFASEELAQAGGLIKAE